MAIYADIRTVNQNVSLVKSWLNRDLYNMRMTNRHTIELEHFVLMLWVHQFSTVGGGNIIHNSKGQYI